MSNLRSSLIRLAHQNPEFRAALLPLLKQGGSKQAASEISIEELPESHWGLVKIVDEPAVKVWGGVHGYIVEFKARGGGARLERDRLKRIVSHKNFRWLSPSGRDSFSIGM